jgi:hypothetical protein
VDWAETIEGAYSAGVSDPITKVGDFLSGWYGNGPNADGHAKDHLVVMESYKQIKDGAVACGRP